MASQSVLFLCTGNYYRSRYAEELFNRYSRIHDLDWEADSAGLAVPTSSQYNQGPISEHTLSALARQRIKPKSSQRMPRQVASLDFDHSDKVIALCEREHRPMLEIHYPDRVGRIEFWQIEDIDVEVPEIATQQILFKVAELIESLSAAQETTLA